MKMDRNKLSIFHLPEHNKLMIEGTIEYMVDSKKEGTSTLMGSVNSEYMWMQTIDVSEMGKISLVLNSINGL